MTEITSQLVKTLREKTGAGMMDCKKALEAVNGDLEEGIDWLRKKGLSAAAKKSGRVASEGLIGVVTQGTTGVLLEVNAETDFVARNEQFQKFVKTASHIALEDVADLEALKAKPYPDSGRTVEEELTQLIATVGENMTLRRLGKLKVQNGVVCSYIHTQVAPELGRIGVLVALESTGNKEKLHELGMNLAMHIAAARPEALKTDDVSSESLDRERRIFREQSLASGKSEDVIEKMIEGRIRKYLEEVVLWEQVYVIDGKSKISKILEEAGKEIGTPVTLIAFERFELGEGIEKKTTDFASEVAEQLAK
ncbi:MAG: elongation factor Ts [Proteobacteria bacterium]|nr:elongation factor Ts [Pseudomonadota bacterium]